MDIDKIDEFFRLLDAASSNADSETGHFMLWMDDNRYLIAEAMRELRIRKRLEQHSNAQKP